MKVFFIGTVVFSEELLKHIFTLSHIEVVGVATKQSSNFNSDFRDLSQVAVQKNVPYKYIMDINNPDNIEWIKGLQPDVIFCFGWSSLLKEELLNIAPMGVIGYHPANLPYNRGRHPIIWALCLGLDKTASTFFKMDLGADTGDILSQEEIGIDENDDSFLLYNKLLETSKIQVEDFSKKLAQNTVEWKIQDKNVGNYWRKRSRKDGLIDFRLTSKAIHNLVKALARPYPGAEIFYNDNFYQVWKVKPVYDLFSKNIEPGKVLSSKDHIFTIKTGDGAIEILEHEFEKIPLEGEYI